MNFSLAFAFLFYLLSFVAMAQQDWEAEYIELCKYDNLCNKLKDNSTGEWIKPKEAMVKALKILAPEIQVVAKLYNVSAEAIAAAILTENSLNVTIDDGIQDFLVKMKLAPSGSILGKKFSFGWGQLYMEAAWEAEETAYQIEKRPKRTKEEIAELLLTPLGAITYVAALLRTVQDQYKKAGFDIKNQPEILATLYNLGQTETRANEAKLLKRNPRVNFFGFFVKKNMNTLKSIVGNAQPVIATNKASSAVATAKSCTVTNSCNDEKKTFHDPKLVQSMINPSLPPLSPSLLIKLEKENKNLKLELTKIKKEKKVILYQFPTLCYTDGTGSISNYNTYSTYSEGNVSYIISPGSNYSVISDGLDCKLNNWKLIKTSNNEIGWISDKEIINAKMSLKSGKGNDCNGSASCHSIIKNILGDRYISSEANSKLIVKIEGKGKNLDYSKPNIYCYDDNNNSQQTLITKEEAIEMIDLINKKEEAIKIKFNLESYIDAANPYKEFFLNFNLKNILENIINDTYDVNSQSDLLTNFKKFIGFEILEKPDFFELHRIKTLSNKFRFPFTYKEEKSKDAELYPYQEKLFSSNTDCLVLFSKFEDNKKSYLEFKEMLENTYRSEVLDTSGLQSMQEFLKKVNETCIGYKKNIQGLEPTDQTERTDVCTYYNTDSGYNSYNWNDIQATLKNTDEKLFLASLLDGYKSKVKSIKSNNSVGSSNYYQSNDQCDELYRPEETAVRIEKLIANNCASVIYVPDYWLVKRLHQYRTKVFYKPFLENDRYEVKLKCQK